jgi:uncharacterized protein (UPF0276 family)
MKSERQPAQPIGTAPHADAGPSAAPSAAPRIGIGYRAPLADWTRAHLARFDVLEVTIDHCLYAGPAQRRQIYELVEWIPLTAHGIGLSIGTDCPLDSAYLDQVATIIDRLKAPAYSEHLAFTRVPGRDLGNLLPVPRTGLVAEQIIAKIRDIRSRLGVPFLIENIANVFEWPQSTLSEVDFINLICCESGAGLLLDVENLYVNSRNHQFDAHRFLDALSPGLVQEIHMAGGIAVRDAHSGASILADSHSHPVGEETLALLDYALERHHPKSIVVERDDRLEAGDEILADVARIRALLADRRNAACERVDTQPRHTLLEQQTQLLAYLTSAPAIFGSGPEEALPPLLRGIDRIRLGFEARFSHEKRMEKLARLFPRTLGLLEAERGELLQAFAEACPPTSIGLLETAQQFLDFLSEQQRSRPCRSNYACDVARCELALAKARFGRDEVPRRNRRSPPARGGNGAKARAIRRADSVALVRCEHDVRCLFESSSGVGAPKRRDTPLVIAQSRAATAPEIFEIPPALFDLLAALDHWTERSCLGRKPGADALIADLVKRGLLEVRA